MIRFGNEPAKPDKLNDTEKKARATALAQAAADVRKAEKSAQVSKPKKPATTASKAINFAQPETKSRGRPKSGNETVTLRLSTAALDHFREGGAGWQGRINEFLCESINLRGMKS